VEFDKFAVFDEPVNARCELLVDLAKRQLALRDWERQHLPIEASQLGYELFLVLAKLSMAGWRDRSGLLKQLYLALPYSEKGIRLHLRRLEETGWLKVSRSGKDGRVVQIELSARYWQLLGDYGEQCRSGCALADLTAD
jgi:DNA-binding MarR family transcriptional regulator